MFICTHSETFEAAFHFSHEQYERKRGHLYSEIFLGGLSIFSRPALSDENMFGGGGVGRCLFESGLARGEPTSLRTMWYRQADQPGPFVVVQNNWARGTPGSAKGHLDYILQVCSFIFLFLCHTILAALLLTAIVQKCICDGEAELESMFSTAGR